MTEAYYAGQASGRPDPEDVVAEALRALKAHEISAYDAIEQGVQAEHAWEIEDAVTYQAWEIQRNALNGDAKEAWSQLRDLPTSTALAVLNYLLVECDEQTRERISHIVYVRTDNDY